MEVITPYLAVQLDSQNENTSATRHNIFDGPQRIANSQEPGPQQHCTHASAITHIDLD